PYDIEIFRRKFGDARFFALQLRVRPLSRKNFARGVAMLDKRKVTDAALGFGNERLSKWRVRETELDLHSSAAIFHLARRSGFDRDTEIMEASGPGETGLDRGIEDIATIIQKLFHMLESKALQKIFRSYTRPS